MQKKIFCPSIPAKVAERILRHQASLADILLMLLQDSICAKASQVIVSKSTIEGKTWLSLSDDGEEIFVTNNIGLKDRRTSTGMYSINFSRQLSIYNLFDRGALVESKKLSLSLAADNFPISRDVQMRSGDIERGTKISFPLAKDEITELLRVVKWLALFYPIAIVLDGSSFTRKERSLARV